MTSTLRMPRLPAVMAMLMPGLIFSENCGCAICASTTPGISSAEMLSRGNVWRAWNISGISTPASILDTVPPLVTFIAASWLSG